MTKVKKVSSYVLLILTAGILYLLGEPRIFTGIGIPQEITDCIRTQQELAQDYARRGISLSGLGTDTDNRLSSSSQE